VSGLLVSRMLLFHRIFRQYSVTSLACAGARGVSERPQERQGAVLNQALSAALFVLLFFLYLIVEVFLAMATYMYLNLYHPYTFGSLIGLARGLLNSFTTYLEQLSPELANRAYATLLGELGPKSVLLLLIGLIVSALARLMIWAVKNALKR
jgi:hypothetical protein